MADVTGHVQQGVRFCFPQLGQILFMPSHDLDGVPINHKTTAPETLPVDIVDGMTCVTIYRTGKLVLVESDAAMDAPVTVPEPEPVWVPAPVTQCGETRADGSVVHVVQPGHHCWAIAEACGIFMEDIQQLNPGFGDCRMLHPGDELVIRAPFVVQTAVYEVVELAGPGPTVFGSRRAVEFPYDDPEFIAMEERVLLAVARCMRDYATSYDSEVVARKDLPFRTIKREARRIAEEAWRNRGSDHWTAQLGDGRMTVRRKWYVRNRIDIATGLTVRLHAN